MLLELEIKDFALVEHLRLQFSWGLNVMTGETGAGKSIIMDALNVVLGGRVGPGMIRPQAEKAVIEASFKSSPEISVWLKNHELVEDEEDSLICSREIRNGASKMRINGVLVNLALVQELKQRLVTVHAQHESRTLLSSQSQLEMLDALGDAEHKKILARLKTLHAARKQLELELADLLKTEHDRERRLDFAQFQLAELQEAQLQDEDEDELIGKQRQVLSNVSELETLLSNAQIYLRGHDLDGQPGILDLTQKALLELSKAAELDGRLTELQSSLEETLSKLEDDARSIRKHCEQLEADPETLAALEERAAVLAVIKRKYGPQLADAISRQEELSEEIEKLGNSQAAIATMQAELESVSLDLLNEAESLSRKRVTLAALLSEKIQSELVQLGMSNCRFEIALNRPEESDETSLISAIGPCGFDRLEFLICPNPGQPMLPVSKIASGGELSRVMLAVKTIFAAAEQVATVIFDEIDTGLSGKVLQTMRDKLARLARSQQILCITHQPIIASVADNHIHVSKEQTETSTRTCVTVLNETERLYALAGMASGQEKQEAALRFAQSLFQESERVKKSLSES